MINGFRIGHHTADHEGWLTGTTVIRCDGPAVGGVDVRGGGPGTRETDALDPTTLVPTVNALVLTGGSAYGLAAADGVMQALAEENVGFPVGAVPHEVVPIVPAAVIFDLGRGGDFSHRPTAEFGRRALAACSADDPNQGSIGAGTGAVCGGLRGGFGYAERTFEHEGNTISVGAAAVVNAAGFAVDPVTGRLHSDLDHHLPTPTPAQRDAVIATRQSAASINTTIGVILTDAELTKSQATKVAQVAHDGLARAVRPVHSMSDGDTIFCLAHPVHPPFLTTPTGIVGFNSLLNCAADVFTDACRNAIVHASGYGQWRSWSELMQ